MQEVEKGTDVGAKHNDCEAIKSLMEIPDSLHGKCCSYQITSEKCERDQHFMVYSCFQSEQSATSNAPEL